MANPWLKFYPTDWRSDPKLRMCSAAARGLWIEMICLMHESTPYGHLLVGGHSPTDAQLSALVGIPSDQLPNLVRELEEAGVFSRTRENVIYSRKMSRSAKKAATARNNGRKGGNPNLSKERINSASVNLEDKPPDKPQKPEARIQNTPQSPPGGGTSSFSDFWERVPKGCKNDKAGAVAQWRRMNADDRQAAFDSVVAWYAWEMNAHKDRTPLYPTRYLSKRRWEDEGWQPPKPADPQAKLELWAKSIRDGTFVSPSVCPPQMCRAMIEAGLVTAEQVQARGLVA